VNRRKPAQHRKEQLVQIRVTAEQKQIMTEAADRVGLDLSSWLRQLGLKAAEATSSTQIKSRMRRGEVPPKLPRNGG
jgi:uncharacterized protein (DUF1778 family)